MATYGSPPGYTPAGYSPYSAPGGQPGLLGIYQYTAPAAPSPYASNLQDQFNIQPGGVGVNGNTAAGAGGGNGSPSSSDPDVMAAQSVANEEIQARLGRDPGVSYGADDALINMYKGRIGQKNALGQIIGANGQQELNATLNDYNTANNAVGQGVNNTRRNFASHGLLYSGMRQAGEQSVRGNVANALGSSLAGTKQDYANTLSTAEGAYGQVDLASQTQTLAMAQNAVNTASANNVARLQAMQQLGGGVGAAAGSVAGSNSRTGNPASYVNPAAGWDPNGGGLNTPYDNGSGQFGGYLANPDYSSALGNYSYGSP